MNKCLFCNINDATQTDSHIFTDFMTVSLKREGNFSRVYTISKTIGTSKPRPTQDTPKESYLFCPGCENDFSRDFERRMSFTFYKDFLQKKNQFGVIFRKYNLAYQVYTATDYILFKKFIFLQLYRTSVCNLPVKNNLVLSKEQMDIVYKNLSDKTYFQDIKTLVFTTDFQWSKTANLIFAGSINGKSYILRINEFIFIIQFDPTEVLFRELEHAANYENNSPRVMLASNELWNHFTNSTIDVILGKSNAS